jgi:hypothetical protein
MAPIVPAPRRADCACGAGCDVSMEVFPYTSMAVIACHLPDPYRAATEGSGNDHFRRSLH